MPVWSNDGPPAGPAQLHPDRRPDRVHPRPEHETYTIRDPELGRAEARPDHRRGRDVQGLGRPELQAGAGRHAVSRPAGRTSSPRRASPARRARRRLGLARAAGSGSARSAGATVVESRRHGIAFTTTDVTAPADQPFVIDFDNQDAGTPHNVEIKDVDRGGRCSPARSSTASPTQTYQVPALAGRDATRSSARCTRR